MYRQPDKIPEQAQYPGGMQAPDNVNNYPIPTEADQQSVTPQQSNMPDPFRGSVSDLPDTPIGNDGGMMGSLLNDDTVPTQVKKKFWFVFAKDNVLTFLDQERKESKLTNFDIAKIDILNSIPYYDYTFEQEAEWNILRNVYETKLDRALGFKAGTSKNERIVLQSQFSESRHVNADNADNVVRDGFFKKLLGRR